MAQLKMLLRTALGAGRGAVWRTIWPHAGLALLGACAALGPPDIETSRTYQGVSPDWLYQRTLAAMRASELEITETDRARGVIAAIGQFDARDWAECAEPLRLYHDQSGTNHMVEAREDHRRIELTASVSGGPEGTTLTLDPAFSAEPVSAMATDPECRTTGALERQILDAVAAPAAG